MHRINCLAVLILTLMGQLTVDGLVQRPPMIWIHHEGRDCAGMAPRDSPPTDGQMGASCTIRRKDIRDREGRIISGFGIYAWTDAKAVRVRVLAIVPAPGVPNRWLYERGDDDRLRKAVPFVDYTIAMGQSKRIAEMKALGIEPWLVRFLAASPGDTN